MTEKNHVPNIGVSWGAAPVSGSLVAIMTQIRSAGGNPIVLEDFKPDTDVAATLSKLDGLVLMGNDFDNNPASYGQSVHPKTQVDTDTSRTRFEEQAIRIALEQKMPLMGVCGGMQRINTLDHADNGGTLHQHVPDVVGHEGHGQGKIPPFQAVQEIRLEAGSQLAEIVGGAPTRMENSFHHQAIDKVHKDFRVSARADDGIIEAIEPKPEGKYGKQLVIGTQWHPEFGASDIGGKLATRVVEEARFYAHAKQQPAQKPLGNMTAMVLRERENTATIQPSI